MSESKCQVNGNKIEPCAALAKSLEHDAEYTMRKGLLIYRHVRSDGNGSFADKLYISENK